jgi:cellulose synthase operon protein C
MLRRAIVLAAAVAGVGLPTARGDEDIRTASAFVQGLREHKYYDLATEYLERLRKATSTPPDLRATIDYELGRILLDEASSTGDLGRKRELLEEARAKLDAFTKANPKHDLFVEASVQKARLLVERGHLARLQGDESEDKAEKAAKLAEARSSFDQARKAYAEADERLQAAFKEFPPFIPEGDPRKAERDRVHTAMMDAQIQKAIVDHEQGDTYPPGSKERAEYLAKGLSQFEELYKRYRTQLSGLFARMWQAKCYEEKGDYGPAMGIYNELMDHPDPRLRGLQRTVGFFQVILYNKRKEYPLAVKGGQGWLNAYTSPDEQRSKEGLGIRLEMAKALLAQIPTMSDEAEKTQARARAVDLLGQVVRIPSPFRMEAVDLLKQYKPKTAAAALDPARLSYEDARGMAEQAIASQEWDRAIPALKVAIRKADAAREVDKVNEARYLLALSYLKNGQPYEAEVLADHLARRYPRFSLAPKAAEVGMAALADAYNSLKEIDRSADLKNLIALASFTAEAYPDTDQGDTARMTLGQIHDGMGDHDKAIQDYEAVRPKSARWVEARTRLGTSRWERSLSLRRKGTPEAAAEADEEVKKALETLNAALKARRDQGAAATDPGLMANACDIADIDLQTGKASEALALLGPIAQSQAGQGGGNPAFPRLMATLLRAHVAAGQVNEAIADMGALEKAGGGNDAQLYLSLGELLEKEMDAQRKRGDSAGLAKTQAAYQKFLSALIEAKAGQTYRSLQWAGESMLALGNAKEAAAVFNRVLDTFGKDQAFLASPTAPAQILRTRLKLAAALRARGEFDQAGELVETLIKENPRAVEPRFEKGMLLEAKADADQGPRSAAYNHWRTLALQLANARPKPAEYYDAWYHAAVALSKDGQASLAKQTLGGILRLSPNLSGPEMKAKYQDLLARIK